MYTHISALHTFSIQHKFLCSLAFIPAHPFPGRQAVYFLCTFNSKYTYVFPMGAYTLLPFPHVQGGIETVLQHHRHHMTLLWHFFFPFQHWQRAPILFVSTCWPSVERAEGLSSFFLSHPCWKDMPKWVWCPLKWLKRLPTFPYSSSLFYCVCSPDTS